ncbi:hypothetical protein HYH02_014341 [Chlamydomonas schloesseri]|uniref:CAP-Gly domain-containing protein n=1 Tax=Chlamydomonas schloesseri TaxID=2026947 RepID=A0A835SNU4_9CHLO|nr:hypothetical protein HYH02_014341 [Chlamydomonas schloesseri]|eukprot:KAG2428537.1 hypothetical protein HYH02_014341 [Chlamydomonas schloesseri]
MATPAVGCRVRIIKDYATVRYVGPVAGQEGTWVGVEWDDVSRGKHDGSTGGVRYFDCKNSCPTAGSFVRIERVNFGISVLEALRARYNNETAEYGAEVNEDELYVHTSRKRRVKVQLVGEEKISQKQRQIHTLESARLVGLDISAVGDGAELAAAVPALTELDVTANLVASWSFAEQLATALPRLSVLNLSENKLAMPGAGAAVAALPGLRALVLNDCGVTWQEVLRLAPCLPSLEELHLCGNPIPALAAPAAAAGSAAGAEQGEEGEAASSGRGGGEAEADVEAGAQRLAALFPNLQVLTLEEVGLGGWSSLALLGRLPRLGRLHLAGNTGITAVAYLAGPPPAAAAAATAAAAGAEAAAAAAPSGSEAAGKAETEERGQAAAAEAEASSSGQGGAGGAGAQTPSPPFAALAALYLGGCGIADWASVNELDRFPALKELRLSGNPVLQTSKTGGRFEVIGRVSGIASLNGAEVRPRERRDSELRYLQHIAAEMEAAAGDDARRAAVRSAHPRLRHLMETHGAVLATAARGAAAGGGSLAASTVELKLTCVAAAAHAKMGTQVKRLPRSTTVSALRLLCEKLFKVKADCMALFLRSPGDPIPEDIGGGAAGGGQQDDRPLSFFGVQDGTEVLVDEIDLEALKKADEDARAAASAAHEQRLAEQLRAAERLQAEFARSMGLQQQQQQQPGAVAGAEPQAQ